MVLEAAVSAMNVAFNTLRHVKQLEQARIPAEQARAHVHALQDSFQECLENLATRQDMLAVKQDVLAVRKELSVVEKSLEAKMAELKMELKIDMTALQLGLKESVNVSNARFDGLQKQMDMMRWLLGGTFTSILLLLIRTFFPNGL